MDYNTIIEQEEENQILCKCVFAISIICLISTIGIAIYMLN